jgi:hypothetical protein
MKRIISGVIGAAMAATIAGAAPAVAAPSALSVQAVFVNAVCQGGDFAKATLTAQTTGATGDVKYKWDWTNNGSFDTAVLSNPQATHLYGDELTVTARVGARDSSGATAFDTVTFSTPRCV